MMGTRRWVGALEAWLSNTDWTKDKLAERSQHSAAHVREMFERADPNPTLRLYLELVQLSGARFQGVTTNEPVEVIKRIKEILVRENIATVSALAKVAQINRSQLSTLFNDPNPNPTLGLSRDNSRNSGSDGPLRSACTSFPTDPGSTMNRPPSSRTMPFRWAIAKYAGPGGPVGTATTDGVTGGVGAGSTNGPATAGGVGVGVGSNGGAALVGFATSGVL